MHIFMTNNILVCDTLNSVPLTLIFKPKVVNGDPQAEM